MIWGIEKEWSVFIQAILAGNVTYLVYCVIRVFRRIVKHNLWAVSIEDVLYWIGVGLYLFVQIYQTSSGTIRWYFVLGTAVGGILTHFLVVWIVKKYLAKRKKR